MAGALIGALRVSMGLDSAAWEKGSSAIIKQSRGLERSLTKVGQRMTNIGQSLTLGVTAPLTAFGVTAGKAASDAAELQSAFDQTFGGMAKDMTAWAQATGDTMGRSTQAIQQAANTFGIFFNQAAPTRQAAADLSKTFAVLAQDLSSFYNVSESDALAKLRSGLAGESEPLRDFGVFLTEASVKAKAFEMGLADANGEISEQAKVLARANLILAATTNAQGDVARTAGGTANQVRAAKAAFEELQVIVGTKLLPVVTPLITKLAEILNAFSQLPQGVQTAAIGLAAVAAAAGPVIYGVGALVKGLAPLVAIMTTAGSAGGALAAMKAGLLGIVGVLGPFGIAVAAVAAGLVYLSLRFDENRRRIDGFNITVAEADAYLASLTQKAQDGERTQKAFGGAVGVARGKMNEAAQEARKLIQQLYGVEAAAHSAAQALAQQRISKAWTKINDLNSERARIAQDGWQWGPGGMNEGRSQDLLRRQYNDQVKELTDAQHAQEALNKDLAQRLAARNKAMTAPIVAATAAVGNLNDGIGQTGSTAERAVSKAEKEFRSLEERLKSLVDRLLPDEAATRAFREDRQLIENLEKRKKITPERAAELHRAHAFEGADAPLAGLKEESEAFAQTIAPNMEQVGAGIAVLAERARNGGKAIGDSFRDAADATLDALDRMAGAIKGGGFLNILSSVINMGLQLGSIGAFGSKIAANINIPKFANGTSFAPGGLALVGERGPELVNLPRGSQVFPNGSGPQTRVQVIPSPLFDVVVDGRILSAAPAIASAGGEVGVARMRSASQWALR